MKMKPPELGKCALLAGLLATGLAFAEPASAEGQAGAVVQSVPPAVSQHQAVPPLHLSDAQRAKIRQAVGAKDTEVTFTLKATKSAESFLPAVGASIPKALKPHPLPRPLVYEIPELKRYTYLKLKNQVLIVDPMTRKIVDMFPEGAS